MLYFALKIVSWSECAYESTFDQTGYSTTRASIVDQTSTNRKSTLLKLSR